MVLLEEIDDEDVSAQQSVEQSGSDEADDSVDDDDNNNNSSNKSNNDSLKEQAKAIILSAQADPSTLPDALHELLTDIIKPLFSVSKHPELTSTGRKVTVPPPPKVGRFQLEYDSIFDNTLPWKTEWTTTLLSTILQKHSDIEPATQRKASIESNFHLLVPAILNQIDSPETKYKIAGCNNLTRLCELLASNMSEMMHRTGLTTVFTEALEKHFAYLPTLTPEDESLRIMKAVYPAWFAVIEARFVVTLTSTLASKTGNDDDDDGNDIPTSSIVTNSPPPSTSSTAAAAAAAKTNTTTFTTSQSASQISSEIKLRQSLLTSLLRHSLLYSLNHLSSSPSPGGGGGGGLPLNQGTASISPTLTSFFISQIPRLVNSMGIYIAAHLQYLLPLLKQILMDPFAIVSSSSVVVAATTTSMPQDGDDDDENLLLPLSTVDSIICIIEVCWPRVRERWWAECLEGLVGCWINLCEEEEEEEEKEEKGKVKKDKGLKKLRGKLKKAAWVLQGVMTLSKDAGDTYEEAKRQLVAEDDRLIGLFEYE